MNIPEIKTLAFDPVSSLKGELLPPGDKSISHRMAIFGSLAKGRSVFDHFLTSEDCLNTLEAFRKMGVIADLRGDHLEIAGAGLRGLKAPASDLYMGNSGTSTRLLLGVLSAQSFCSAFSGDASLSRRPMDRVVRPLREMGAQITGREDGKFLPLNVTGRPLKGIRYSLPVASAQVKSCLLLAGLFAEGVTEVEEKVKTRDHTEKALEAFGADYSKEGQWHRVSGSQELRAIEYLVPGDISSAAFFIVGALIAPNSQIRIKNVGLNPTRTGILEVLRAMGAQIRIENVHPGPEPSGDLVVTSSRLKGVKVDPALVPFMIDEIPILSLAAALSEGETLIEGARELRVKESDRIAVVAANLKALGVRVDELPDGLRITGREILNGGVVESHGDHRVVMTFAIASLRAQKKITIRDTACVDTSYPGFFSDFAKLKS